MPFCQLADKRAKVFPYWEDSMEKNTDLRIQKTYLALQNAFVALLEEKRFEELTVNELCDRAMIRRTTFYKHFGDKYEYFAFYIREMVSTFRDQLPPDVMDGEAAAYFLQMSQELLRFWHMHEKMVHNIENSSMFPLLLSILLDQITEDIILVLRRSCPELAQDTGKLKGVAAFYAGGLINAFFRCTQKDSSIDENAFLEIAAEYAAKIPL